MVAGLLFKTTLILIQCPNQNNYQYILFVSNIFYIMVDDSCQETKK